MHQSSSRCACVQSKPTLAGVSLFQTPVNEGSTTTYRLCLLNVEALISNSLVNSLHSVRHTINHHPLKCEFD